MSNSGWRRAAHHLPVDESKAVERHILKPAPGVRLGDHLALTDEVVLVYPVQINPEDAEWLLDRRIEDDLLEDVLPQFDGVGVDHEVDAAVKRDHLGHQLLDHRL